MELATDSLNPDPEAVAAWLDSLAITTGDGRYRRAAGALRVATPRHSLGRCRGRPTIDDSDAIAELRDLLKQRSSLSISKASRLVAIARFRNADRKDVESIARRLRNKLKK